MILKQRRHPGGATVGEGRDAPGEEIAGMSPEGNAPRTLFAVRLSGDVEAYATPTLSVGAQA